MTNFVIVSAICNKCSVNSLCTLHLSPFPVQSFPLPFHQLNQEFPISPINFFCIVFNRNIFLFGPSPLYSAVKHFIWLLWPFLICIFLFGVAILQNQIRKINSNVNNNINFFLIQLKSFSKNKFPGSSSQAAEP